MASAVWVPGLVTSEKSASLRTCSVMTYAATVTLPRTIHSPRCEAILPAAFALLQRSAILLLTFRKLY